MLKFCLAFYHQKLEVNSLGDAESRERYQTSLREYLSTQKALLTTDSVLRFAHAFLCQSGMMILNAHCWHSFWFPFQA